MTGIRVVTTNQGHYTKMGLVKSFKKLLKSNDKTEASTSDSAAVAANTSQQASVNASNSTQPSPSAPLSSKVPQPRTDIIEVEQSRRAASSTAPESLGSSGRLFSGLPPNSSLLLGVGGRIASFTSTDR